MSPLPTSGAPKDLEELKELLKDDTKIKVAGKLSGLQLDYITPTLDGQSERLIWCRCGRRWSAQRKDHVQGEISEHGQRHRIWLLFCHLRMGQ